MIGVGNCGKSNFLDKYDKDEDDISQKRIIVNHAINTGIRHSMPKMVMAPSIELTTPKLSVRIAPSIEQVTIMDTIIGRR